MYIATFGMIIKDYKLGDFSSFSHILMLINTDLPDDLHFNSDMTGRELVDHVRNLPYEKRTAVNGIIIISEIEEFSFYREMQILEDNNVLKQKYNNTVGAGVLMGGTWGVIVLFVLITIIYHYNTVKNNDVIKAEITNTVINLLKYVISTFI